MRTRFLLSAFLLLFSSAYSQVTIGSHIEPEDFSVLQLDSNSGGLRLNNLNTVERDALSVQGNPSSKGLVIYNTDSKAIEIWDGEKWNKLNILIAANGLNVVNDTVKLGGSLKKNTTIDLGSNNLNLLSISGLIGIGTNDPKAKLHVNGDMILSNAPLMNSGVSSLVRNNTTGAVGTLEQMTLTLTGVAAGTKATVDMTNTLTHGAGFLVINTSNACSRGMESIFSFVLGSQDFGMSIAYLNGMGRDVIGQATRNSAYNYKVQFPSVAGCGDGGNATQFDYTIDTSVAGKISITNNGNIARNYTIRMSLAF